MSGKYDLSSISAISAAAEQARARAGQEQNQSSYNAAWLHGYAQALADAAEQLEQHWQLIAGIPDRPNDGNGRTIRFIDSEYHQLFTVSNGANIVLTQLDGTRGTLPCQYINNTRFY